MNLTMTKDACPSHACNCIGPQKGAPLCPCMMPSVTIVNGRYVQTIDLGPAREKSLAERLKAGQPKTKLSRA